MAYYTLIKGPWYRGKDLYATNNTQVVINKINKM